VGSHARPHDRRDAAGDRSGAETSRSADAARERTREAFLEDYPAVLKHLVFLTNDRALAEDLSQEAFGKLVQREEDPAAEPLDSRRAWLLTVASNLAYNHFRSETRRQEREGRVAEQTTADVDDVLDVRTTLARLEPRDRTVLMLRYTGFTYAEIAEVVGLKASSVGTTLARAQERFRTEYEAADRAAQDEDHDTGTTTEGSDPHAL
jgi:RNA polymerase sigma factor (sigma-70 family)